MLSCSALVVNLEHFIKQTPESFSLPSENPGVAEPASCDAQGSPFYYHSTSLLFAANSIPLLIHTNLFLRPAKV